MQSWLDPKLGRVDPSNSINTTVLPRENHCNLHSFYRFSHSWYSTVNNCSWLAILCSDAVFPLFTELVFILTSFVEIIFKNFNFENTFKKIIIYYFIIMYIQNSSQVLPMKRRTVEIINKDVNKVNVLLISKYQLFKFLDIISS